MSGLFPQDKGFAYLPLLSVLFVILFSIGMYLAIGNPGAIVAERADHSALPGSRQSMPATTGSKPVASVANMTEGLAARLERGTR